MPEEMWWRSRLVGFDLETTSPEPTEARIVTAAVAVCGGGEQTETQTWLADPGVEIPEEAAEVHGVSTEKARAEGEPIEKVVGEVLDVLEHHAGNGFPLVVFNARYDFTVLDREARRLGLMPLFERGVNVWVIDPLVMDKWLDRYRKGSRKLDAICAHYGAELTDAHTADADAIAAARAGWVLGAKGKITRKVWNPSMAIEKAELERQWEAVRYDLDRLHTAQRGWAHEQAAGLADYFREQRAKGVEETGDPDGVRTEWPVVPFDESEAVAA